MAAVISSIVVVTRRPQDLDWVDGNYGRPHICGHGTKFSGVEEPIKIRGPLLNGDQTRYFLEFWVFQHRETDKRVDVLDNVEQQHGVKERVAIIFNGPLNPTMP